MIVDFIVYRCSKLLLAGFLSGGVTTFESVELVKSLGCWNHIEYAVLNAMAFFFRSVAAQSRDSGRPYACIISDVKFGVEWGAMTDVE